VKHLLTLNDIVFRKKTKDSATNIKTHTRQTTVSKMAYMKIVTDRVANTSCRKFLESA